MSRWIVLFAALSSGCVENTESEDDPDTSTDDSDTTDTDATDTDTTDTDTTDTDTTDTDTTDTDGGTTDTDTGVTTPVVGPCDGRVVGTQVGECAPDFALFDRFGVEHSLYDYAGDVIALDVSAMWCPLCQNLAPTLETLHNTYAAQGVTVMTVLFDDAVHNDPDDADLLAWEQAYGVSHLLLRDVNEAVWDTYDAGYQPSGYVIDRDLTILYRDAGSAVRNAITAEVVNAL